jgi:hypothetical protein
MVLISHTYGFALARVMAARMPNGMRFATCSWSGSAPVRANGKTMNAGCSVACDLAKRISQEACK